MDDESGESVMIGIRYPGVNEAIIAFEWACGAQLM